MEKLNFDGKLEAYEFNKEYQHWNQLVETNEIPPEHEIRAEWAVPYCDRLCDDPCPKPLVCHISLYPSVENVADDSWTSPSDNLIGKVRLKPPLTNKYIKAITHRGILEIGHETENNVWNDMEKEKRRALWEQALLLKFMFEKEKQIALSRERERERQRCAEAMEQLSLELEAKLARELAKLEAKMLKEREQLLNEAEEKMREKWEKIIDEVVEDTVTSLTKAFLEAVQRHAKELEDTYIEMLKRENIKSKFMTDMERVRCDDMLRHLKHNMECDNIANMMYMLCTERHKCQAEIEVLDAKYSVEVKKLTDTLDEHEHKLKQLTDDRDHRAQQLLVREKGIVQILKKFQKFINYALKATPTQAEFLLNLERMIECELAAMPAVDKPPKVKDAMALMSVKSGSEPSSRSSGLIARDFHNCFDEFDPPPSEEGVVRDSDTLPAMYVKGRMYVREDFRNMFSQGLAMSSEHMLWNKDVEMLMKLLRRSVTSVTHETELLTDDIRSLTRSERSIRSQQRRSSVHFHRGSDIMDKPLVENKVSSKMATILSGSSVKVGGSAMKMAGSALKMPGSAMKIADGSRMSILREHVPRMSIEEEREVIEHPQPSKNLISARNSLELVVHRKESPIAEETEDEQEEVGIIPSLDQQRQRSLVCTTDSIEKHRRSLSLTPNQAKDIGEPGLFNAVTHEFSGVLKTHSEPTKPCIQTADETGEKSPKSTKMSKECLIIEAINLGGSLHKLHEKSLGSRRSSGSSYKQRLSKTSARDSVEEMRRSLERVMDTGVDKEHADDDDVDRNISRLSMVRDSVEMIKSSKSREPSLTHMGALLQKESVEIIDGLLQDGKTSTSIIKLDDFGDRSVRMSHIEIHEIPEQRSGVMINPQAVVVDDLLHRKLEPRKKKHKARKVPEKPLVQILEDQPTQVKVIGDRYAKEHLQTGDDFTMKRINSMLAFLKRNPSLIKTFVATYRDR